MSAVDPTLHAFLERYMLRDRTLTNIAMLDELLPAEPAQLRSLATHATGAALEATERGYLVEARRLAELARQLTKRALKIDDDAKAKGASS